MQGRSYDVWLAPLDRSYIVPRVALALGALTHLRYADFVRTLLWVSLVVSTMAGCMVDFPEPPAKNADAGSGGSSGASGGAGGTGAIAGAGGNAGGGGSAGSAGGGGSGAIAGAGGTAGSSGSSGTAGSAGSSAPNPIGYWPMEENTGTTVGDKAGTPPRDGSFTAGKISWTTSGKFGNALVFADDGAGLSMPGWWGASFPPVGTLSFWVKTDLQTTETKHRNFFDRWEPAPARNHIFLRREGMDDGFPMLLKIGVQSDESSSSLVNAGQDLQNKVWRHVAVAWDSVAHTCAFYTSDGVNDGEYGSEPFGTKTGGSSWSPSGQEFVFGRTLIGTIDEVSLFDQALGFVALDALSKRTTPLM